MVEDTGALAALASMFPGSGKSHHYTPREQAGKNTVSNADRRGIVVYACDQLAHNRAYQHSREQPLG
jgi:hypothetical protein